MSFHRFNLGADHLVELFRISGVGYRRLVEIGPMLTDAAHQVATRVLPAEDLEHPKRQGILLLSVPVRFLLAALLILWIHAGLRRLRFDGGDVARCGLRRTAKRDQQYQGRSEAQTFDRFHISWGGGQSLSVSESLSSATDAVNLFGLEADSRQFRAPEKAGYPTYPARAQADAGKEIGLWPLVEGTCLLHSQALIRHTLACAVCI